MRPVERRASSLASLTRWASPPEKVEAPEADTYIYENYPNSNYGTGTKLEVGSGPDNRIIYFRFSVTGIPAGAVITGARLKVTACNGSTSPSGGGTIYPMDPVDEMWDENHPTWNAPLEGLKVSEGLDTVGPISGGKTYEYRNLESVIQGNGRFTFAICSTAADGSAFYSKEDSTGDDRPVLTVDYETGVAANQLPEAVFNMLPASGDAPLTVNFDASSSEDTDGSIVSYEWDFGDGSTGTGVSTTHTYNDADTYTVTLTVTDDRGGMDIVQRSVVFASHDVKIMPLGDSITLGTGTCMDPDPDYNCEGYRKPLYTEQSTVLRIRGNF